MIHLWWPVRKKLTNVLRCPHSPYVQADKASLSLWQWRLLRFHRTVALEKTSWCKLAQLVTDHILRNKYRNKFPAVVYRNGVADHVGYHRRPPRPRLDKLLVVRLVEGCDFFRQTLIDKWTFANGSSHLISFS